MSRFESIPLPRGLPRRYASLVTTPAMLTLSRLSLHTAAFLAGAFATALIISRIDNAFVAPQAPQAASADVLGRSERADAPIPRQTSQKALSGAPGAQYANGLLTGP